MYKWKLSNAFFSVPLKVDLTPFGKELFICIYDYMYVCIYICVIKQLKELNINKASGPDEIPARRLRDYADEITPLLTHLFQQSYLTKVFCQVIGSELESQASTNLEIKATQQTTDLYPSPVYVARSWSILSWAIMSKFLAANDIINSRQHGFRKGLSCENPTCGSH